MCYNTGVAQGYSSAGRVPVSKTVGRGFESSCPCHVVRSKLIRTRKTAVWQANRRKTGDFERFLPFFRPCIFSEFHRSLLPFSMLCTDSDSRKGLFCVFPKAIDFVAGFGFAKAEPDSVKKLPLHKLFTNTIDPSSNCPDLNSRD